MDLRCDNRANIYIKHTTLEMLSANRNVRLDALQENGHNLKIMHGQKVSHVH